MVVWPWHASRFDLCSGEAIDGPAVFPEPRYDVRVRGGKVELGLAHEPLCVRITSSSLPVFTS